MMTTVDFVEKLLLWQRWDRNTRCFELAMELFDYAIGNWVVCRSMYVFAAKQLNGLRPEPSLDLASTINRDGWRHAEYCYPPRRER